MVDVNLSLIGKVNENNQLLTFRNKASFAIRKVLRKKAYTMAIDIVIKSVDFNLYENSKANPSIQFYGYCVLVFQDMNSIEIPIHFPRQRLYYAIQHEAFRQWRGFVNYYEQYLLHRQTGISLGLILAAFEIPPLELETQLAKTQWVELPLREVYIKCQKNTQFEIEYTAWEPVEFVDPISGEINDGESNQEDGEKDDGLPKDGIQPKRNSPSNPFGDNPSPSSIQELGQKGFDELDDSKLGNIDSGGINSTADRTWDITGFDACGNADTVRVVLAYNVVPEIIDVTRGYRAELDTYICNGQSVTGISGPLYSYSIDGGATDVRNTPYASGYRSYMFVEIAT